MTSARRLAGYLAGCFLACGAAASALLPGPGAPRAEEAPAAAPFNAAEAAAIARLLRQDPALLRSFGTCPADTFARERPFLAAGLRAPAADRAPLRARARFLLRALHAVVERAGLLRPRPRLRAPLPRRRGHPRQGAPLRARLRGRVSGGLHQPGGRDPQRRLRGGPFPRRAGRGHGCLPRPELPPRL
ncbi:hypothetical protein ACU4GR_04260 [Methylobacterium oryzae CBMB20]